MLMRPLVAALLLTGGLVLAPVVARAAEPLCKPGHILDESRGLCYDPATAYRPNVPAQQSIFGSGGQSSTTAQPGAAPRPTAAPSNSGGGFFGWLGDQARFCRYGDRQVGSGDAAYCVGRDGKSYPAGK